MKLLVSDPLSESGLKMLKDSGIPVDVKPGLNEDELCAVIGEYDVLIIRSGTEVTKKVLDAGKKLRVVGRAGVGVDNVDVQYATQKGIIVMNTPFANILSAAEHSLAMMMSLARKIPWAHESVHKGEWKRSSFTGTELYGKTLGIIGVGRVGGEVAKRARPFNMSMMGYDPFLPKDVADSLGVILTTLEDVLKNSDIMTIHAPLLPETKNMISMPQFKIMKKNALLINVARGGIVNEDDLYTALKEKMIAGAAFDVFLDEPLKKECKLLELDNLIMTPHLGASTIEAQEKVSVDIAESVIKYMRDKVISNAINAPRGQTDPDVVQYIPLAEYLGAVAHQLIGMRPVNKVEVICNGEMASKGTKAVTLSVLVGVLKNIIGDGVNTINAESIAESKNMKVIESKNGDSSMYLNTVTVSVTSGNDTRTVCGTVFAHKPRLVCIDDYHFEMPMDTDMLYAKYRDKPGAIGNVGKILGENGINIGQMTVGREVMNGMSIMLIGVDHKVPPAVIKKICAEMEFDETKFIGLIDEDQ